MSLTHRFYSHFSVQSNADPSDNAKSNNNSSDKSTLPNNVPTNGQIVNTNLKIFTFAEIERATQHFTLDEGNFGTIFKGWLDEMTYSPSKVGVGKDVAIKRLEQKDVQKGWVSQLSLLSVCLIGQSYYCLLVHYY